MRLFENSLVTPSYRPRLVALTGAEDTFSEQINTFLADRFVATHTLKPSLNREPSAFFTNGNDERLQRAWARENCMKSSVTLDEILLAQIEAHRADVFYTHDAISFPSSFARRLPGCVKKSIAWRAAPSGKVDFGAYDLIVCNFPSILESYRKRGWRVAYFTPAHDPEMDTYARNTDRPVDVLFIGTFSRHHRNRSAVLEAVAQLRDRYKVVFHLDSSSKFIRLAESPLGLVGPLQKYRRPRAIRTIGQPPVFGRNLYEVISRTKIVLNGAIDMSGDDRGNMRCWEAMGCGALLLSDAGHYPEGMEPGRTLVTYNSACEVVDAIEELLHKPDATVRIARAGHNMVRTRYSKDAQWKNFCTLI